MATLYRVLYWLVLALFGLTVQTALLPQVFPQGYVPDVLVPLVVLLALYETPRRGLWLGIVVGALADIWGGRLLGLNTFTLGMLGYTVAQMRSGLVQDPIFVPGIIGGLAECAVRIAQWLLLRLSGYPIGFHALTGPLPYALLFGLLVTPALGAILGFRPLARPRRRRVR